MNRRGFESRGEGVTPPTLLARDGYGMIRCFLWDFDH